MFDPDGVHVDVDHDRAVGLALETGVDVLAAVEHLVGGDVGAEVGGPLSEPRRHGDLALVARHRSGLERVDARDADEITIAGVTVELDDVQFIPVAASGRFEVAPSFTLGADVGYAIGINDGNDGGFYYSPRAQYSVSEAIDIVAAYRGVSVDGGSWDIISAGVEFGID